MVDYAIRKRPSGYEELVYARTLANDPKSRFISSNNLICPECGEPVILANGDERTYFRHLPNNPKTKDCPNYYSDDRYAALYQKQQEERKSGQRSRNIYILKGGDTFGLFLGFPPLEERIVTSARNENLIVQIINPHNAELKENRLLMSQVVAGENTYIQLKLIYDYYSLKYSKCSVNQDIINIWKDYQAGLPEGGALFRYSSNTYARCISENAEITTDKYYYLATASKILDNTKDFLEHELLGTLEGKSFGYESKWWIYQIQFLKVTEDAQEFANNFRVKLIEWHPPLIPLWPPHVQFGKKQIYSKLATKVLNFAQKRDISSYYLGTEGQARRSISKTIPKIRIKAGWLLYNSIEDFACIKSSHGGYEVQLTRECSDEISRYLPPEITVEYGKEPLATGEHFTLKDKCALSFKSDSKCNIYHYSEDQLKQVYWNEQTIHAILNLSNGDRICVLHGMDVVYHVHIPKFTQTLSKGATKSDEEKYGMLTLTRGTHILSPVKIKYLLSSSRNGPKVNNNLVKTLKSGKTPIKLYYHLISEFSQEIGK
ncbi:MAG: hypothetical protein PHR29_06080 [Acholeplasmataceae bacterium]|nr:hypothetical protein [Acholeplasmataceae bacterium]